MARFPGQRPVHGAVAALGALLLCAAAHAEVKLETSVGKVETTLDAGGRVKRELVPAEDVLPGEELRYTITFTNDSETVVDAERIVITNPIPDGTRYVPGSAGGDWSVVEFSTDGDTFTGIEPDDIASPLPGAATPGGGAPGTGAPAAAQSGSPAPAEAEADSGGVRSLRWTYRHDLAPGASDQVFFHVRML